MTKRESYPNRQHFGTYRAARYLGITLSTLKHHIYTTKKLVPDARIGENDQTLVFTRGTLDAFLLARKVQRNSHAPGRPPTTVAES
jgi:hypothetical protein